MKETYAEAGVKRRGTMKTLALRILMILAIIFTLFISMIIPFAYIAAVAAVVGTVYMFPRLNVEYEYIYCDGQIDFDKIMGNAKRKTVLRIEFENVELVAPSESDALRAYSHKEGMVTKDFSSLEPNAKTYAILVNQNGKLTKIIFEPSPQMMECIRYKSPRKVTI